MPSSGACGFEAGKILGQGFVVGVLRIRLDSGDDCRRADEAGDVVDVAVGVVAGDSAAKPDDLLDAEIVVEGALKLLAADAGVPLLHFAEQAFFSCQQDPLAVGVDGTAFEDEPALLAGKFNGWLPLRQDLTIQLRGPESGRRGASRDTWPRR